ncbi:MAG: GerMN domain-containing protein [Gudongella sp.]|jgi:spore germination protein GerM|nr:GerMN domain-containing protein [Gudongella sp.]
MKKLIIILLSLSLLFGLAACVPKQKPQTPVEEPSEEPAEIPAEGPAEEPIEDQTVDVLLYFGNNEYIVTGDEQYERMMEETQEITYGGDVCLEEAVVRALMAGPEDTELMSTGFTETIKLNSVEVFDGTAYVDFASDGLHGGSMQESYIISQVVMSLTNLDSVDSVMFLVDGQEAETLMGHISIEEPMR